MPRPVRDYVRSVTDKKELNEITRLAATLYFGDGWPDGNIRKSTLDNFRKPVTFGYEISNATSIILRLLNDAIEDDDERTIQSAVDLSRVYLSALHSGSHYRSVVTLATDILSTLPEGYEDERAHLNYERSRAVRMTGADRDARDLMLAVDQTRLPVRMRQSLLVSLALAHQGAGDSSSAVECAKSALKLDKHSSHALHARAIILEEDSETTSLQLRRLELQCRKEDAVIVANNLAMKRSSRADISEQDSIEALDGILRNDGHKNDFYNSARAIVKRVDRILESDRDVGDNDKSLLISAYHFLYSERLEILFDQCHDVLWRVFTKESDQENLLRLFRHSSLIWRLRGDVKKEKRYLQQLARTVHELASRDIKLIDKETAYFLARSSSLGDQQ